MRTLARLVGSGVVWLGVGVWVAVGVVLYQLPQGGAEAGAGGVFFAIVGLFVIGFGGRLYGWGSDAVRINAYQRVAIGDSFDDVLRLLGRDGRLMSSSTEKRDGTPVERQQVMWDSRDSLGWAEVIFENGLVVEKSQLNFK